MLSDLMQKNDKLVIGLMSGTSADGVDAVLVRIQGHGLSTTIRQLAFVSPAYPAEVHDRIIRVAKGDFGGAKELCLLNFYLSELFVDACLELCEKAGVDVSDIDLIGTHGQTVYHIPEAEMYLGKPIRATLQIGDPSLLCEKIGAVTVSDFRVRDMGGDGSFRLSLVTGDWNTSTVTYNNRPGLSSSVFADVKLHSACLILQISKTNFAFTAFSNHSTCNSCFNIHII